jgi:hypothetical protein
MKSKLIVSLSIVVGLAFIATTLLIPFGVKVKTTPGSLSLSVGMNQAQAADELSDWTIKYNPTGTHIKDGYLKIRLDFYPSPASKTWEHHHVYVIKESSPEYLAGYKGVLDKDGNPVDENDYAIWLTSLPRVWRDNPALCHFVIVPPDITSDGLQSYIIQKFSSDVIATLDDILIQADSAHLVSPFMRDKTLPGNTKVSETVDKAQLVTDVNTRLSSVFVKGDIVGGESSFVEPQSITIGPGATDRAGTSNGPAVVVDRNVTANDSGSLDTWELFVNAYIDATDVKVGTCYVVSGTNLTTRDYETIGTVANGSKQTFTSLSTTVVTGDYPSLEFSNTARFERDTTGVGIWYVTSVQTPFTNLTFTALATRTYSMYGTGTESGGTPSLTNAPSSDALGMVNPSTTYWTKNGLSAPSFPLTSGNCTFTITNDGDITIDISANATNPTGGTGATLTSGSPGANEVRVSLFKEGDGASDNLTLVTYSQNWISSLAASANISWDVRLEIGTSTEVPATQKTFHIYLLAGAS